MGLWHKSVFVFSLMTGLSFASVFTECERSFSDYKTLSLTKRVWEYTASPQILIMQKSKSCLADLEYAWQGALNPQVFWKILNSESKGGIWLEVDFSKVIPTSLKAYLQKVEVSNSQIWVLFESEKIKKIAILTNRQGGQYLNLSKVELEIKRSALSIDKEKLRLFSNQCKAVEAQESNEMVQVCGLGVKTQGYSNSVNLLNRSLNEEIEFRKNLMLQCSELAKATQDKVNIRREIKQVLEMSLQNNFQDYVYRLVGPVSGISWQMWEFLKFTKFEVDVNEFCKDEAFFSFSEIKHSFGVVEFGLELGKPSFKIKNN